jgi:hypothetical protein
VQRWEFELSVGDVITVGDQEIAIVELHPGEVVLKLLSRSDQPLENEDNDADWLFLPR